MDEVFKTILLQILGYFIAMIFSFVLFAFWQRGYFLSYLRVRTSLGKLILVKLVGPTKIDYKIGRIEEGNLLWGKIGKDGHILNDIKRDYIYTEQNVNCVDIDSITYAFMPKEVHYAKAFEIPKDKETGEVMNPEQYAKVFKKDGNEVIVTGIEGFDPEKVDSLVQRAQFKPSQIHNTVKLILMVSIITLIMSGVCLVTNFMITDKLQKIEGGVGSSNIKIDQVVHYINSPKVNGTIVSTGG